MSAAPGWYPDPAGQPDHLRYFDGQHWAEAAVPRGQVPGQVPPPGPAGSSVPVAPRRKGPGVVLAVLGVAFVLAIIGVIVWQNTKPGPPPPPVPSPASETFDADAHPCPSMPAHRNDHPNDGMVHGGGLAFDPPAGFEPFKKSALPDFATDAAGVQYRVPPRWSALLSVGAIPISEYPGPTKAVTLQVLHCIAGSDFYPEGTTVEVLDGIERYVDNRTAYSVDARLISPDSAVPVDRVEVTVVMTRDSESLGVFFGAAPEGERSLTTIVDHTLSNLVVE